MDAEMKEPIRMSKLPPNGYVKRLAETCSVSVMTVTKAIRYNGDGPKCDAVRTKFRELYPECL